MSESTPRDDRGEGPDVVPGSPGSADSPGSPGRINHWAIALLGLVTIVAYGSWYYAFGVLFDPIRLDTGWGEAGLAASFSVGTVVMGLASILGGRALDRFGGRVVLLVGAAGGGAALLVVSVSGSLLVFAISAAVAMGFLGGFAFYHTSMTLAVRIHPGSPARAIAVLTIWGAFASAVYLPSTAALLDRFDWRVTVRILAVVVVAVLGVAALALPAPSPDENDEEGDGGDDAPPPPITTLLRSLVGRPDRRAFTAAVALGGIAMSTVLVYQVPTMTAAGLPLTTAATVAGIRGFAQTGGRIPLTFLVNRLGSGGALVLAFASLTLGGALLAVSGTIVVALVFAAFAGFGIGAFSPLQGITSEELYPRETLGATMGLYSTVLMVAGAAGPVVAGILAESTGDRRTVCGIVVLAAAGAMVSAIRLKSRISIQPALG